ncbi:MAG: hypothetical protein JWM05_1677, partial [Acidimicrobiales bacterium]|nr:hypothetical protein [Acidimicrobiales bacterium]
GVPGAGIGAAGASGTPSGGGATPGPAARRTASAHTIAGARQVAAFARIPRLGQPLGSPLILALFAFPGLVLFTSATSWLARGQPILVRARHRRTGTR